MEMIKMAWRNIWRNKRRTLIAAASLYFAIVFAIIMRSMQLGTYDIMINNVVESFSGFIQIQDSTYWLDKSIDDMMEDSKSIEEDVMNVQGVKSVLPRLETFSLVSSGNKTKGAFIQGINPEKDDAMTHISKQLISGNYINSKSKGIVVTSGLASFLGSRVGDTLVMISQGYHGISAADQFPILGIVKLPSPQLDNRLIIMPLELVREFTSAQGLVTSLTVNIDDRANIERITKALKSKFKGHSLSVLKWTEMNKTLEQQIASDNASGIIMLLILYMVIFFGILGTVIMMTSERMKEFGVMVAVGMKRIKLILLMLLETLFIGLVGLLSGIATTIPIILYFYSHPIRLGGEMAKTYEAYGLEPLLGFSIDPMILINQFYSVLLLLLITLIYPVLKISKLNIINALRS
ncbi:MAG: hypothetical protein AUJ98_08980 [Bacteroidetes bacterium CG2_30_33_31]|nr:MAG: hypothetical protein AUJ98_08980 [Bacteroidetes bacterium CG2_30_33_31]